MIFKIISEKFPNDGEKQKHYKNHVTIDGKSLTNNPHGNKEYEFTQYEFETANDYEKGAKEFVLKNNPQSSKINSNCDVVGFMGKDNRIHLYDPGTGEFVIYKVENGEIITFSYYLFMNDDRYYRDIGDWYKCEIPKNYNKQIRRIDYDI